MILQIIWKGWGRLDSYIIKDSHIVQLSVAKRSQESTVYKPLSPFLLFMAVFLILFKHYVSSRQFDITPGICKSGAKLSPADFLYFFKTFHKLELDSNYIWSYWGNESLYWRHIWQVSAFSKEINWQKIKIFLANKCKWFR